MIQVEGWNCLCSQPECLCYRKISDVKTEWILYKDIIINREKIVDDPARTWLVKDPK